MKLDEEVEHAWQSFDCHGSWELERAFKGGYRAAHAKYAPQDKVVDLSVVCGSNIPMKFRQSDEPFYYGWLEGIASDGMYRAKGIGKPFSTVEFDTRPVAWFGGECPLPEGVEYNVYLRGDSDGLFWRDGLGVESKNKSWLWVGLEDDVPHSQDVIAFQVTGLADGWRYPWEQSK